MKAKRSAYRQNSL